MERHKYLEDCGMDRSEIVRNWNEDINDPRLEEWEYQRSIYGFDERETWNMDTAFVEWLLERTLMYKEKTIADLTYHKYSWDGRIITQEEAIDILIEKCKFYLLDPETFHWKEEVKVWKDIASLWGLIGLNMWW